MTEFADNVRRLAKGTRRKSALGAYQEREPVLGGSVTLVTNAYTLGGGANDSGETPASEAPNSETSQENSDGDQPAPDPNNPNSFYQGGAGSGDDSAAQQGQYDVEDVIDGTAGPQTSSENDGSTPTDYNNSISSLDGATDCTTGKSINFHTNGNFPVPEGWDDADTPPVDEYYQAGYYWTTESYLGFIGHGRTPIEAVQNQCDDIRSGLSVNYPFGGNEGLAYVVCDSSPTVCLFFGGGTNSGMLVGRNQCGTGPDPLGICNLDPPLEKAWPEDGAYDLALIDGGFQTNQYDSEAPAGAGGSKVNFCFGSGRYGSVEVTANGGWMVYETSGGSPTGTAKVYGADGTFQAAGDSTEQFMDQYRPK